MGVFLYHIAQLAVAITMIFLCIDCFWTRNNSAYTFWGKYERDVRACAMLSALINFGLILGRWNLQ